MSGEETAQLDKDVAAGKIKEGVEIPAVVFDSPAYQELYHKYTEARRQLDNGGIPLISVNAVAGFGKGECQVMEYECERYVVPMFKEADFLIPVKGSSMIPKYNSGDVVACKSIPLDDIFFQWNKVYVLDTIQGALVKRIKKGSDAEHISIVSDNLQYEPFELHKSQVYAVAIVVGVIRLE
jgi:phage repressor protein C with HTH and peptisase S24 domain